MTLQIRLLGQFELAHDGELLPRPAMMQACSLLAYLRSVLIYRDQPGGSEMSIDVCLTGQTEVAVACAPAGDCLVVSARGGSSTAWDISGRLVSPLRVYLPLVLRQ